MGGCLLFSSTAIRMACADIVQDARGVYQIRNPFVLEVRREQQEPEPVLPACKGFLHEEPS